MKRYIRAANTIEDTDYVGYCLYTAGNDTWGYDARRQLHELGCARGYVKFPNERGGFYRPVLVYLFDSEDNYNEFKRILEDRTLDWHIKIEKYRDIPEGTIIIEED